MEESILNAVKKGTEESGVPYLNLINRLLQQSLADKKQEKSRLDKLEEEIPALKSKFTA